MWTYLLGGQRFIPAGSVLYSRIRTILSLGPTAGDLFAFAMSIKFCGRLLWSWYNLL